LWDRGCELLYLPPYSPDFNLIAKKRSRRSSRFLQMIGARTRGALLEVIGTALDEVSTKNAKGFFAHCGYHTLEQ
jgi:hypothetical protein